MLQRTASNPYSWWWASHNHTKHSKWLDQSLQDMDVKVKRMVELLEPDVDSFPKRAEMYYKKRPELLQFVEEIYRAFRSLAERYDQASMALQKAYSTFPERFQYDAMDDVEDGSATSVPKRNHPKQSPNMPSVTTKKSKESGSGMSKEGALAEIDRLQRAILTKHTEKEFTKSSYESGLAKYWEIEQEIVELQTRVSALQDEFGVVKEIADDEAACIDNNDNLEAPCQTGGADLHKIRSIEVIINSEPVDTSKPDPDAASIQGTPIEDQITSPHLIQHTATKNDTKLKAPADTSEPHPITMGHTSSGIEGVVDLTPVDKGEPDPPTVESTMPFIFFLLPKDHEIEEDTLIQFWMAEDYINDEQEGRDCFESFFKNGYLLHCGSNFMTGKDRYRINTQMINEFHMNQKDTASCYLQWNKDCTNISAQAAQSILHVSLLCNAEIDATTFKTLEKYKELRTLLFIVKPGLRAIQIPSQLLSSFKELRILDLSRTYTKEFPSSIGHMIQLRYLDLSWTLIKWLPDVVCSLTELQTLKLRGCSNLTVLPKRLNQLTKLRHLDAEVLGQLEAMPRGIGALKNLRTLQAFLVGTENGCKITELTELNSLSGELCIANLENVESAVEAQRANLAKKLLKKLELRWTSSAICGRHQHSYSILEKLKPNPSLEELKIVCYEGIRIPPWIVNPGFNILARIKLYMCENLYEIPRIELLPSLVHLELVGLNKVKSLELQRFDDAFPKLEKLEIDEMESLRVWKWKKTEGRDFRSLTHLIIRNCPSFEKFDVLPHLSSIKYFEIRECPNLHSMPDMELPGTSRVDESLDESESGN